MKIELKCINCEQLFEALFKHRDKKFCNRKCYFEYNKKNNIVGRKKDLLLREIRKCVVCENEFEVKIRDSKKMCSDECRKKWNLIQENKDKRILAGEKVLMAKYGVTSAFKLKETLEKSKNTLIEKYGISNPMDNIGFINKLKNSVREKQIKNILPKLSLANLKLLDEYTESKLNGKTSLSYNFKCLTCNNIFTSTVLGSGKIPICRKCNPLIKNSKLEEQIRDFLNINNIKHIDSDRKILNGKEIDLLINDYNLGIEIDGNYYHSEIGGGKDKKYHINKTILATNKNIKLIHIFEDELLYKKDIVFSRLLNIFNLSKNKIYARKTEIREVDKKEAKIFLDNNHIQGNSIDKIRIGLYYNNELVSLMTFGKLRNVLGNKDKDKDSYELTRFCNKLNTSVIGSFSKLLKNFIKLNNPLKIITYADIRWSGINELETVYYKNGFNFIKITPPNYWYLKVGEYNQRFHRFNYRKDVLVKQGNDINKTEFEIMRDLGYDRIWDCGTLKFELNIKT